MNDNNENTIRLFVYGTLKEGHGNHHHYLSGCKKVQEGWLYGFEMWSSGIPYVRRSSDPDSRVYGEVYEVDMATVEHGIDLLEGHPSWYKRTFIDDQLGGVWVYLNSDISGYHLEPVEDGVYR